MLVHPRKDGCQLLTSPRNEVVICVGKGKGQAALGMEPSALVSTGTPAR